MTDRNLNVGKVNMQANMRLIPANISHAIRLVLEQWFEPIRSQKGTVEYGRYKKCRRLRQEPSSIVYVNTKHLCLDARHC